MIHSHGSELDALSAATLCNFAYLRFDFTKATWDTAPDDLLERIHGEWHPKWDDERVSFRDGERYQRTAEALGMTAWPEWNELDRVVRAIAVRTTGDDDDQLAEIVYRMAWTGRQWSKQ